jgi:FdhE protein
MSRTETSTRNESLDRELSALAAQRPELAPWLRPLGVSLRSLGDGTWDGVLPVCSQHRSADQPVLHDAAVAVDGARVRAHVQAVLAAALAGAELATASGLDQLALLERGVNRIDAELDSPALIAAIHLAAIPLMITCARAAPAVTQWAHGYCHVCGGWAVLAEVLGLERTRQLRCGRCCAAWKTNVLVCPFCGESDHQKLGSLVPDGPQGQICWVETCGTCHGYIKTRATLRTMSAENVLIEDARTIDLDIVAAERGFAKPDHAARLAHLRLMTRGEN